MGSIGLATLEEVTPEYAEIPDGTYNAEISNSEWRTSQAGNEYVSVEFTLTSGLEGRKVWTNLNFKHDRDDVQDMARRTASDLCHAIGLSGLEEPEELLGHNLTIKVGGQKNDPTRKEVKRYMALAGGVAAKPKANGAAAAQGPYPWES